jgi:hypothetical protein
MGGHSLHHLADHLRRDGRLRECVMVERATHTPTPWLVSERALFRIIAEWGDTIATVGCDSALRDQWEANAAFIVEAVNSHEALKARIAELEANEKAYEEIIGPMTYRQVADRIQEMEGALQKISDLVESEAGEPLDDAIKIANDALLPKDTAP